MVLLAVHFVFFFFLVNFEVNLVSYEQHGVGEQEKAVGLEAGWCTSWPMERSRGGGWGGVHGKIPSTPVGLMGGTQQGFSLGQLQRGELGSALFLGYQADWRAKGLVLIDENGEEEGIAPSSQHLSFLAKGRCSSPPSLLNIFITRMHTSPTFSFSAASQWVNFPEATYFLLD